jgi:Ca2+:H+ antiporter
VRPNIQSLWTRRSSSYSFVLPCLAATQVHSSLLSISVGAVLLPAAYHFALSGEADLITFDSQKLGILRMSRGVGFLSFLLQTLSLTY